MENLRILRISELTKKKKQFMWLNTIDQYFQVLIYF